VETLIEALGAQVQRIEAQARQLVIENDQLKNQNVRLRSQLEQQRYPYMIRSMVTPLSMASLAQIDVTPFGSPTRITLKGGSIYEEDDSITASFGTGAAIYRGQRPTSGPPVEAEAHAISREARINWSF
jgi:hypothetical protein